MLIIGHKGAAGLAPENTPEAFRAGIEANADILEFDVRFTSDDVPILNHDSKLHNLTIKKSTAAELTKAGPIVTLEDILDEFFGQILLNLEYKPSDKADKLYEFINDKYISKPSDWDNLIISSFSTHALEDLRKLNKNINLGLLHSLNPFSFVLHYKKLDISAVGWHRLHANPVAIAIAKKLELFTYVYTVDRPKAAKILAQKGIDGVVTNRPDLMGHLNNN